MTAIKPFRIAISDDILSDLKSRLARTRWPEAELVDDWSQGAPLKWILEICAYWANGYDWRARSKTQSLRSVHHRDRRAGHPFPACAFERAQRAAADHHPWLARFDRRIPEGDCAAGRSRRTWRQSRGRFSRDLPLVAGFGFSAKPKTTGWGVDRIAATWAKLMDRLGYARYGAQGGDWGSAVTTSLGAQDTEHCAGIHITLAFNAAPKVEGEPTPEEKRALAGLKHYVDLDSGYSKQQSTRPQTLGYGLTDSPSGQAAWILEKFWAWTDCNGHPENIFDKDELLDNVMLYWTTETATSSARLYWESFGKRRTTPAVKVPTGVAVFPKEIITPVRRWMEPNFPNITHWSEMERGGHFAAFEQPALFVRDVRKFFATVR